MIEDKYGYNALQLFASSSDLSYGEVHNHLVDNVCLAQFIRSSKMGLLKKEDVCDHCLVQALCLQNYFANPAALARTNGAGCLPLHYAAEYLPIQGFLLVFQCGIRYYSNKNGNRLMFQNDKDGKTPLHLACDKYPPHQSKELMDIVNLRRHYTSKCYGCIGNSSC